eukprot:4260953-Prymnesium_polylepis.1
MRKPRCAIGGSFLGSGWRSGVGSVVSPPPVYAWSSRCEMGLSGHAIESPNAAFKGVARQIRWRRTGLFF